MNASQDTKGIKTVKKNKPFVKTFGPLSLGACMIIISPWAAARTVGWYVGANVGQSRSKIADGPIARSLTAQGFSSSSINNDSQGAGFKLFGGYQFNRYFALESGYFNLGDFGYTATTVPAGTSSGRIRLQGMNFDAVGILPITQKFSAFGRVGVTYVDARDTFSGSGADYAPNSTAQKHEFNYKYGIGLQYALTRAVDMRMEAERYRVKDAIGNSGDVDLVSLGVVYRFGGKSRSQPVVANAEPTPVPYVAPTRARHVKKAVVAPKVVTLGDVYFRYNKTSLTEKGEAVLDKNIAIMRHNPHYQFRIAGYTSAAGTTKYNQTLSEGRAQSVKDYLIHHGGIAPGRLTTIGFGDTRPAQFEATPSHLRSKAAKANMRVLFEITVE